jgi:hypothetical protein
MTAVVRKSASFGRSRRWALYIIGVGVWSSGGLWLLFRHFFVEPGEFGPKIHPLEPWWLKLHGAFGFAAVWILGFLWSVHVSRAWHGVRRRWSGGVMIGVFSWLILSGYLLYYIGTEDVRSVVSVLHWGIGLASPICLGFHRLRFQKRGMSLVDRVPNRFKQRILVAPSLRAGEERQ